MATGNADRRARSIKVVPVLRAANVVDPGRAVGRPTAFFKKSYDMRDLDLPGHFSEVTLATAIRLGCFGDWRTFELWEPLWIREFPRWLLVGAAAAGARRFRKDGRLVVVYAIENNDLDSVLFGRKSRVVPARVAAATTWTLRWLVSRIVDRIAYGTTGARMTYERLVDRGKVDARLVVALPAQHPKPRSGAAKQAVFVGILEPRKGVEVLLRAWEAVEVLSPDHRICIVGGGPLLRVVQEWAARRPQSREAFGWASRAEATSVMRNSAVLVAPSLPEGRWREQIGLPIAEALSLGLTVVTTDQTGLADELARLGHHVVPVATIDANLATSISAALSSPLDVERVLDSLPERHGQAEADHWLHR